MTRTERLRLEALMHEAALRGYTRRQLVARAAALGITVPAAAGLLGNAGAAAQGEPSGKIVLALPAEPEDLENWGAFANVKHPILRNLQEGLINRDPETNELVGELATAWEQTDDVTWRFTLREGVTFHNGEAFNAEVAAFGLNYTWSPENNFDIRQFIGPEMHATVVDEYTIDVKTDAPDPILPSRLYMAPFPSMRQVQESPETLPDHPIGTGPYIFQEWSPGQYIRAVANPDWWGNTADDALGATNIQEVEWVFRAESPVRAAMVNTGEAQFARFLTPEDCETTPQCVTANSVETLFLRLDTMHPVMSDIRIRTAIALSVNKETVAEQLFGGSEVASQLVGPSATGYNASLEPYPFDMEQAKQLVEEAAADGVPIDMELTVATRKGIYPRNDEFAEYVANQLNESGLNAHSEVIEVGLYNEQYDVNWQEVPKDRGFIGTNPHGNEIMDVSGTVQTYYLCDGAASTYCNPELADAFEEAVPLTGEARQEALAGVTQMFYDDYGAVPIIHMPLHYGLSDNLEWKARLDGFILIKEMKLA